MNSLTLVQMAEQGQRLIEDAIVALLNSRKGDGFGLGAAEIGNCLGIFRDSGQGDPIRAMNDAIVTGVLIKLYNDGKVRRMLQVNGKGGWMVV